MTSNQKICSNISKATSLEEIERDPFLSFPPRFQEIKFLQLIIERELKEMAMGGYYKGNGGNNGGGGNRGRPYALMLLIAFGAALVGVMVLHKLRERRIFSLLLKEKDHQLLSLQLLLQVNSSLSLSLSCIASTSHAPSTPRMNSLVSAN